MADYGFVVRLLAVLHSLPLWLFVALAAAGYGALFLPPLGGADIVELRQQWAPYFWLDATIFTVFALSCAADLTAKGINAHVRTRNNRRRRLLRRRYFEVYNPLAAELLKIHITTGSTAAPRLKVRLQDTWEELHSYCRWRVAIRKAIRTAFNTKESDPHGEVDFGDDFPIEFMRNVVQQNLSYCDEQLVELVVRSWSERVEQQIQTS
ncbi:MAG: hypothetical protein WA709_19415 [Stellaceae bacterium]